MFRRLKWRFVVLIMSMLILVFVGIFGAIYGLMSSSMNRQSQFTLEKIMRAPPRPVPDSRDAFGSLIVETDSQGEILLLVSYLEVDEQAVEAAVEKILSKATAGSEAGTGTGAVSGAVAEADQVFGRVKIGATSYDYLVSEIPAGYKMVLLDRTPVHASLNDLLMVFIWVGVGSLLVLFGVSVFFASRAVRPIQAAFEKQQQFLADASHELRTPLTIIQTQLALLGSRSDPQEAKWIEGHQN
jgi:two-component system, OmpR family, sensor histidine kinase CiaH